MNRATVDRRKAYPIFSTIKMTIALSLSYFFLCATYIWLSDTISISILRPLLKPQWNQIIKVLFFILLTSSIFFFIAWYLLRRISKNETEILLQKNALILSERPAMAGIFASSVAHDINNILTVLISNLEELSETNNLKPECRELISQLNIGVESLIGLAKRLLNVGKEGIPGDFIYAELISVIKETINFAKNHK